MATYIYIDDTGTSQTRSNFKYDTSMSQSWCAVLFNDGDFNKATEFMKLELSELNEFIGLNEFHFADIFGKRDKYKSEKIEWEPRLHMFFDFAYFSKDTQFPVFIQTFGEDYYARIKLENETIYTIENFKVSNYVDFSLCVLLFQIRYFLNNHPEYKAPYGIIIDEGKQKKNSTQRCSMFGDRLENQQIVYKSSSDENLLQLVDFVAFTLNRCQWLNMKESTTLNDYDKQFLYMGAVANFNGPFLIKKVLPADHDRRKEYEKLLDNAVDLNVNFEVEMMREFIDKTYKG